MNKYQGILPTNILSYLINLYSFTPDVYTYETANIMCQLSQYFIQQQRYIYLWDLC